MPFGLEWQTDLVQRDLATRSSLTYGLVPEESECKGSSVTRHTYNVCLRIVNQGGRSSVSKHWWLNSACGMFRPRSGAPLTELCEVQGYVALRPGEDALVGAHRLCTRWELRFSADGVPCAPAFESVPRGAGVASAAGARTRACAGLRRVGDYYFTTLASE